MVWCQLPNHIPCSVIVQYCLDNSIPERLPRNLAAGWCESRLLCARKRFVMLLPLGRLFLEKMWFNCRYPLAYFYLHARKKNSKCFGILIFKVVIFTKTVFYVFFLWSSNFIFKGTKMFLQAFNYLLVWFQFGKNNCNLYKPYLITKLPG